MLGFFPHSRSWVWLLLALCAVSLAVKHPFHTSIASIDYRPQTQTAELALRLFSDDLELALKQANGGKVVRLSMGKEVEPALAQYINQHLRFTQKGQVKAWTMSHKRQEADITWVYGSISGVSQKEATLVNSLIADMYADQANVVNYNWGTGKQTVLYTPSRTTQDIGEE